MVLVLLAQGPQLAVLKAGAALAFLAALSLLLGNPVPQLAISAAIAWIPAGVLAVFMRRTGSLTLALQVTALVAIAVTAGFFVVLGNPVDFWVARLEEFAAMFEEMGLTEYATLVTEQSAVLAPQMTMVFVVVSWSSLVLVLALGYALFQQLPDAGGRFGRFRDVNMGRVLALAMAIASLTALVVNAAWLQNIAFVMFAIFWVQGLAILHWLQAEGPLPVLVLIGVYALLPVLSALLLTVLAVLGYTDAWFEYRPRIAAARRGK